MIDLKGLLIRYTDKHMYIRNPFQLVDFEKQQALLIRYTDKHMAKCTCDLGPTKYYVYIDT